ncbi:MAG: type II secretion system secretin GspD [Methylobacter sp.]|uniref:Type II secretion system secretin GspD n=1 Tax=Candidatus Methylobacter titanis TaxID=3053457 RepID=A0AA43Q740_9GAMM|nr:type II secretion system secretin GspD [Candidatus Methylobacter titanis]
MGLTLSSCELLGPKQVAKLPLTPVKTEQTDVIYKELQNKASVTETAQAKPELFPGTSRFVPDTTLQHRNTKRGGEGTYSLNFDEADLGEVAKVILSDILGQNYVLSPKVAGKVTLQTTDPLSKDELIPTLEMLLRMNNAVLIKDASIYHIEPDSEALYSSSFSAPGAAGRTGFQIRVIPIRNVAVQDLIDVIKPLVQEKTILNVDGARNIMIASGTPDELARVMDMVSTFDIDVLKARSFGLFPLTHVDAETIIKELEEVFNKKAKGDETSFFRFIPIERLNAVMAITHQARYLKDIESWVLRLDRANTASGGGVNVYKVQHVDAVELADTLNEIFAGAQKKDKSAKVAPGTKAVEITTKKQTDTKKTSAGNTETGDAKVSDVGEVRIIADEANNSVIIVATAQEYEVIRPVINQLDSMPLQVLIDATIAEVTLTDNLVYGIQWFLKEGSSGVGSGLGKASLSDLAVAGAAASATGGLSLLYNSGSIKALLSAEATDGNVNVISSPSLMVLNNQEASIQVGEEIPLRTSQSTNVTNVGGTDSTQTSGGLVTSGIQQRKTGVKLTVKPRVNANGLVIMDIEQSVENAQQTKTSGIDSPSIQTREISSSVAVQSGETIVLGGLIKDDDTDNKAGIPFLHELPLIGALFGNTTKNKIKTELVVLITPRVVGTRQDARLITDEFKRKLTGIYEDKAVVSGASAAE